MNIVAQDLHGKRTTKLYRLPL